MRPRVTTTAATVGSNRVQPNVSVIMYCYFVQTIIVLSVTHSLSTHLYFGVQVNANQDRSRTVRCAANFDHNVSYILVYY